MKLLLTTIAAVVLVGCGESQQSVLPPEVEPAEPVAEAAKPEPPTAEAPDISIHEAAGLSGNIEAVKQHLDAGTDVNAKGGIGRTPLHWAARWKQKEIAELLIAAGADVNAMDEDGWTPLHRAILIDHKEIVELLIENGADVNAKAPGEWTPLHFTASEGHKEIVELLIANGADVNAKDVGGKTPLDWATHPDNLDVSAETADLLRKHGGKTAEELK